MEPRDRFPNRRDLVTAALASAACGLSPSQETRAQETPREVFLERAAEGTPHQGKVLLAIKAHSDDIPLSAAGTVAKLVKEGYTGYLVRATNDDMGDAPGLGTSGSIGGQNPAAAPVPEPSSLFRLGIGPQSVRAVLITRSLNGNS